MKTFVPGLLFAACTVLAGCAEDYPEDYIKADKESMHVILGTKSYLNVSYNIGWTHLLDDPDIVTFVGSERRGKGNMSLIFKGSKSGTTKLRLMEGVTGKHETVVDIDCTRIFGEWMEGCEDLSFDELIRVSVRTDTPEIDAKIKEEVLAEAASHLNSYYEFSPEEMTFIRTCKNGSDVCKGTYEQENDIVTLHYDGVSERFSLLTGERCYLMFFDLTQKYKEAYPDNNIYEVSCERCLSRPNRR